MELKFDQTCSGALFVYSEGRRSAVSAQGWTEAEGSRLCQDLKCGSMKSKKAIDSEQPFWDASFSCKNIKDPQSIWDCEKAGLTRQDQKKQLYIECQGKICFGRFMSCDAIHCCDLL